MKQAAMDTCYARVFRFRRGLRAWRGHKGLSTYLGDLTGSAGFPSTTGTDRRNRVYELHSAN